MMSPSRLPFRLRSLDGANAMNTMRAGAGAAGHPGPGARTRFPCYFPATVVRIVEMGDLVVAAVDFASASGQAAAAQVSDKRAACSKTVCVAFSCLSGG